MAYQPRISFDNKMWYPQPISNPVLAEQAMMETSFTSLVYGFGASGKITVYGSDEVEKITIDRLYTDAICLSLGIYTIHVTHVGTCNRLICNCKVV